MAAVLHLLCRRRSLSLCLLWSEVQVSWNSFCDHYVDFSSFHLHFVHYHLAQGHVLSQIHFVDDFIHIALCSGFHFSAFVAHPWRDFDSTLGYPGEGPASQNPKTWRCVSANVDSLHSNNMPFKWQADLVAIQESRIAPTNVRHLSLDASKVGKTLFAGKLLQPKANSKGDVKTPHGGVAHIANEGHARAFSLEQDASGLWQELHDTARVSAVWHQVNRNISVLSISFYCHAGADESFKELNNDLLEKNFRFASQFGDIPVLVCADLQTTPNSMPAFQAASACRLWFDPLNDVSNESNQRPITFSRTANFINPTDNFSSIDAILLNHVAICALDSIQPLYNQGRTHAPIQAVFSWERAILVGFVLLRPAPFELASLRNSNGQIDHDRIASHADRLWTNQFHTLCAQPDADLAWTAIHDFGVSTRLASGATYGKKGPQERGSTPKFQQKAVSPGQLRDGSVRTRFSS